MRREEARPRLVHGRLVNVQEPQAVHRMQACPPMTEAKLILPQPNKLPLKGAGPLAGRQRLEYRPSPRRGASKPAHCDCLGPF